MTNEMAIRNQRNSGSSQSLYNSISSLGTPPTNSNETSDSQLSQESPSDKLMQRAGTIINQFQDLTEIYKGADDEAREVLDAITKWLTAINGKLNNGEASSSMIPQQ